LLNNCSYRFICFSIANHILFLIKFRKASSILAAHPTRIQSGKEAMKLVSVVINQF